MFFVVISFHVPNFRVLALLSSSYWKSYLSDRWILFTFFILHWTFIAHWASLLKEASSTSSFSFKLRMFFKMKLPKSFETKRYSSFNWQYLNIEFNAINGKSISPILYFFSSGTFFTTSFFGRGFPSFLIIFISSFLFITSSFFGTGFFFTSFFSYPFYWSTDLLNFFFA